MNYLWIPGAFFAIAVFYTVLALHNDDHLAVIGLLSICFIVCVLLGLYMWLQETTMRDWQKTIQWISKMRDMLNQRNRAPFN